MRLFRSKKGDFNVLLAIIITLVVGLLLLVIGYQMHMKGKDVDDDEKCRLSIFANAQIGKTRQATRGAVDFPVAFECPRKFLRIGFEDVEKYRRIDDNLLKTMIGEEMKACWSKVGAGRIDPFKRSTTVDEKFCMVCSDIVFSPDLIEQAQKENYNLVGFQYWTAAHKLPGIKTSLYEFLKGSRPDEELLRTLQQSQNDPASAFNLAEKYVVVWRVDKFERGWWETAGMYIGGAVLVAAGILVFPVGAVAAAAVAGTALATTATVAAVAGTTLAVAGAGGAAIGFVNDVTGTDDMKQQIIVAPEELLSTSFDFGDGKEKTFCSVMIN